MAASSFSKKPKPESEKTTPANANPDKAKALSSAMAQIEKQFGKGAVMRLGETLDQKINTISTGSLGLDIALGIGGLPCGRVVEIYGPESSGKTTLTLQAIAQCQRKGGIAAFIDAEHALDPTYAEKLGVNVAELLVSQPDTGEQALEIADMLVRSGAVDLVVVDSVAALTPKAEIEGEMGDSHVGLHARLMSQALRKLTANIKRTDCLVIFINQIRMKIGVMFGCFQSSVPVTLADGSTLPIGKIVSERLPVSVLSFNAETGRVEPRKVVNWFNNGLAERFLAIEVEGGRSIVVTENHTIFTPDGEVSAGELVVGDAVLVPAADGVVVSARVTSVAAYQPAAAEAMDRFDLEVEGNHNYIAGGIVVHNSPETTTGGNALKFYASVRLDIRRIGAVKKGEEVIGSETRVKVVKNKVAPPFRQAEFEILYGEGTSREGEIIELGVLQNLIDKSGAWYSYKGDRIGQGKENVRQFLRDNPAMADEIDGIIRERLLVKPAVGGLANLDAAPEGVDD